MNAKAAAVATEIVSAKPSARRNARALKTSSVHIQFEADSADIDNEASPARGVELAPQIADLHIDDIRLRHKVEIPNILEQHRPRHDLPGSAHEIFEQGEFPRQQINRLAVAPDAPFNEIPLQGAALQTREPRVAAPAKERFDSRCEFANVERLDQIIVAAGLQSVDSVVDRRQRTYHQSGRGVAFGAQRLNNRKTITALQHAVYDQHRRSKARRTQPFVYCLSKLHRMAARLQFEANLLGKVALVFYDQNRSARRRVNQRIAHTLERRIDHGSFPKRHGGDRSI